MNSEAVYRTQIRFPAVLAQQLKDVAWHKRVSFNALLIEILEREVSASKSVRKESLQDQLEEIKGKLLELENESSENDLRLPSN